MKSVASKVDMGVWMRFVNKRPGFASERIDCAFTCISRKLAGVWLRIRDQIRKPR